MQHWFYYISNINLLCCQLIYKLYLSFRDSFTKIEFRVIFCMACEIRRSMIVMEFQFFVHFYIFWKRDMTTTWLEFL